MIEHGPHGDDPHPRGQAAAVSSLVLPEFPAPAFEEAQEYRTVQIFDVRPAERDVLGGEGVLHRPINQVGKPSDQHLCGLPLARQTPRHEIPVLIKRAAHSVMTLS
jgi:hypothetical protein